MSITWPCCGCSSTPVWSRPPIPNPAPGVSSAPGFQCPGTPAAPGDSSGYAAPSAPAPSSSDPQSYGSYGTYGATQVQPSYGQGARAGANRRPIRQHRQVVRPTVDLPQHAGNRQHTRFRTGTTTVFNNPGRSGGGQPGAGGSRWGQQATSPPARGTASDVPSLTASRPR